MRTDYKHQLFQTCNAVYLGMNICHKASRDGGWWTDIKTGFPLVRNQGEMLMLCVTEVAEAYTGFENSLFDDKLPNRTMEEVEMADILIRAFDYAGGWGLRIPAAIIAMSDLPPSEGTMYSGDTEQLVPLLNEAERFCHHHMTPSFDDQEKHLLAIVQAFSEAMEGVRKPNKMHDKYTDFRVEEIGIAKAIILSLAYGYAFGIDVMWALTEKMAYNAVREDHKIENRLNGGKQC